MIKTQKTRIATLLLVLVTLFTALFIPINAVEPDTSENVGVEEITPRAANNSCYYIMGEPEIPTGAILEEETIGDYVSDSFLNYVDSLGYSTDGWYYYMQNYRLPNGQLFKYHIWANDSYDVTFYHRR